MNRDALSAIIRARWANETAPLWAFIAAEARGMQVLWDECADDYALRNAVFTCYGIANRRLCFCRSDCYDRREFLRNVTCRRCCDALRRAAPDAPTLAELLAARSK